MADMVIVGYQPKPGHEGDLLNLIREHVPELRRLGLATERPALAMRAKGGVILEVFEWKEGALASAHENPYILAMWARYSAVCDYVPLNKLPEAQDMFAQFQPIDFDWRGQ
ncbi:hypothetical protein KZX46_22320 (plasmid) [Polymorphobacter sp. PAMC 29334]|uniref:hypothetical protein n=1 Tax=Polymorphobacter sp. PAMC 29334 TaxID=2862331 RepID=UPI001C779646|nr:hypothetical protein [Polymorphobacter sp. PAMC 29334]QYE37129.1 hypothetical protein KZX46_22320 [Polymorphobacter sp. PAMC 29334]